MKEIVIRCKDCGAAIDSWDIDDDVDDPATLLCEVAGDLNFTHTCPSSGPAVTGPDPRD